MSLASCCLWLSHIPWSTGCLHAEPKGFCCVLCDSIASSIRWGRTCVCFAPGNLEPWVGLKCSNHRNSCNQDHVIKFAHRTCLLTNGRHALNVALMHSVAMSNATKSCIGRPCCCLRVKKMEYIYIYTYVYINMYVCVYVWYGMVWYGMVWYGMVWYCMYGCMHAYIHTYIHTYTSILLLSMHIVYASFLQTLAVHSGWKAKGLLAILAAWRNLGSAVEILCTNAGDAPVVQVQTPIAPECKQRYQQNKDESKMKKLKL